MIVHPSVPVVFSSIDRVCVTESIGVTSYFNYLGPKEYAPLPSSFIGDTLINHPTDPDLYAVAMSDGRISKVHPDNADKVQYSARRAYQLSLKKAVDQLDSTFPEYTPKEKKVIHSYVKDSSVNRDLIAGINIHKHPLDAVISAHKAPDDMVVWSGTNNEHARLLGASNEVHHPAFTSTSLSLRAANDFATKDGQHGDIMKIHIPKGHQCAYVHGDSHDGEREVILPRNIVMKIERNKEQVMVTPKGSFRIHHCEIL